MRRTSASLVSALEDTTSFSLSPSGFMTTTDIGPRIPPCWSSTENGRELNIYNNEGTYTAVLRVTDNDGFTDTDRVVITVTEKKIQIDDEGNVTVTDAEEDEEGIPTLSVITTMAAVAVMALRRRPE